MKRINHFSKFSVQRPPNDEILHLSFVILLEESYFQFPHLSFSAGCVGTAAAFFLVAE